ncbi:MULTISPECIES: protein-glutamate O-methyltransferase CheR [Asticcacaulis]|uniref:CheR family methyltransferase n=1 Tax=Asticcacaulis TaxID=76890 RepID=UPI001AE42440|nr:MULTISPECIES: protein-glutamate O-methyltransferase CheR [Asticcacaulis]MBP2157844.1 chemotaxis protein methyltransferase CheR [Asticcacaulis solisilvae]MDR6798889.1 chemotaxis protein methyltransferase CheR [Asticcacaulis sp. BE141]
MTNEDIDHLATMLKARSGLILGSDKTYLIESRLAPVARREGFASVSALLASLRTKRDEKLMTVVTDAMTTNETFFFRDKVPFDQFKSDVLPALSKTRMNGDIKIWCAACSTGQEPYSLAMLMDEARIQFPRVNLDILATDISDRCLEKAQSGLYTQFEVQRGLPITMMVKNFEKVDEMWRISPKLRQSIRFKKVNLLDDLRMVGRQDVIYCRNVLIYFDLETKKKVLEQMATLLADDGYLFLGAAETVLGITDVFKPMQGMRGLYVKNQVAQSTPLRKLA